MELDDKDRKALIKVYEPSKCAVSAAISNDQEVDEEGNIALRYDIDGYPVHPVKDLYVCGARHTKREGRCLMLAGYGTPKFGQRGKRCKFHGGLSTGPKTLEGRLRVAQAQITNGKRSKYINNMLTNEKIQQIIGPILEEFELDPKVAAQNIMLKNILLMCVKAENLTKIDIPLDNLSGLTREIKDHLKTMDLLENKKEDTRPPEIQEIELIVKARIEMEKKKDVIDIEVEPDDKGPR